MLTSSDYGSKSTRIRTHATALVLDSERLLKHAKKPLSRITLADLQNFAQELIRSGLAPISRVRTLGAVKSLFAFCVRMRYLDTWM
jgi:site-specific recombinase XerD